MWQVDEEKKEIFNVHVNDKDKDKLTSDLRPAWMRSLANSLRGWLDLLPQSLPKLKHSAENIKDPLFHFLELEVKLVGKI